MSKIDYENLSLAELDAQQEAIAAARRKKVDAEKTAVIADIKAKINLYHLSARDLGFKSGGDGKTTASTGERLWANVNDHSQTWSGGRGPCPEWLKNEIAANPKKTMAELVTWIGKSGDKPAEYPKKPKIKG